MRESLKRHRMGLFVGVAIVALSATLTAALSQQTLNYSYDELGRIKTVTYSDGKQIVYSYDATGNRTQHIVSATTINRPPVAVDDAKSATEGTPYTFDPRTNDSDPDSNALTVTHKTNGTFGTVTIGGSGTSLTYSGGGQSTDTFTYTISDGNSAADTAKVTMTVANLNPVAVADNVSVATNSNVTFDPRTNDTDPGNDPLSVTGATNGTKGTLTVLSTASIKYQANTSASGVDHPTYTISDGDGGTATGTVNVTIGAGNNAPVAVNDTKSIQKNVASTFDPRTNDTDANADPITITTKTNGTKGTVAINGGVSLTYTPNNNATGADSFTYTIADTESATSTATVSVTIVDQQPPVAVADSIFVGANDAFIIFDPRTNDSDPNGDPLTITAKTDGYSGTVAILGSTLKYTPAHRFSWTDYDSFTYTISDGNGGTSTATVSVTIACTTSPPGGIC